MHIIIQCNERHTKKCMDFRFAHEKKCVRMETKYAIALLENIANIYPLMRKLFGSGLEHVFLFRSIIIKESSHPLNNK